MDWGSLTGILLAVVAILLGQQLEGGKISSLVQPAAFVIVFFGTVGAVLLQTKIKHFKKGVYLLRWVFSPPQLDRQTMVNRFVQWSQLARKEGLLILENQYKVEQDPFIRRGLRLMIDGTPIEKLEELCHVDIDQYEAELRQSAKIWDAAGGYAPTVGILGAVLGLIHVMENLSDPHLLGNGIAVAFVATIYGVGLANLFFLPVAYKIRSQIQNEIAWREMMVDALIGIANSDHPRVIEERLSVYLREED